MRDPLAALTVTLLVLLAGCGGLLPSSSTDGASDATGDSLGDGTPAGTADDPARLGIAVENDHATNHTITVRVTVDDRVRLNRSRRLVSGERWHVANLSGANYDGEFTVEVLVDGELDTTTGGSFREGPDLNRVSGAMLLEAGGATVYNCAGNVTCYEGHAD